MLFSRLPVIIVLFTDSYEGGGTQSRYEDGRCYRGPAKRSTGKYMPTCRELKLSRAEGTAKLLGSMAKEESAEEEGRSHHMLLCTGDAVKKAAPSCCTSTQSNSFFSGICRLEFNDAATSYPYHMSNFMARY